MRLFIFLIFLFSLLIANDINDAEDLLSLEDLLNMSVSSASKYEQHISDIPASVSIITSEEIEKYGYSSLDEILNTVRGTYLTYDKIYRNLGIRGFSIPADYNNKILYMVNGHTMNEIIYGSALIGNELGISLDIIDRIEIVRGPGSVIHGSNAMFLVINIITKTGKQMDAINLSTEFGGYGKKGGSITYGKKHANNLEYSLAFNYQDILGKNASNNLYSCLTDNKNSSSNQHPDRELFNSFLSNIKFANFTILGIHSYRKKYILTSAFVEDIRNSLELKYENNFGINKNYWIRFFVDSYENKNVSSCNNFYDKINGKWWGSEIQLKWDTPNNRLVFGGEYQKDIDITHENHHNHDNDVFYNTASLYLQDDYQIFHNFAIIFGLRDDYYTAFGNYLTPRFGSIFKFPANTTLKLLYGQAYRVPNIFENFHYETDYLKQNSDLGLEKIITYEAVIEKTHNENFFSILSIYDNDLQGIIELFFDTRDSLHIYQNSSNYESYGVEYELNVHYKKINSYFSINLQKTYNANTKKLFVNSPALNIKGGFIYSCEQYLNMAADFFYETERKTYIRGDTAPIFIMNLNLASKYFFERYSLSFGIKNLFDREYYHPVGSEFTEKGIKQAGRQLNLKIKVKI